MDGTPYLSARGLAKVCGVSPSTITGWKYDPDATQGRDAAIGRYLRQQGYSEKTLYVPAKLHGKPVNAYPDVVCQAVLEYYAFDSRSANPHALHHYRLLTRAGLRTFILKALGYGSDYVPNVWRQFHDRVKLHQVEPGYFSVFAEMSGMVVHMIQSGVMVDNTTVPDISVGRTWSLHWSKGDLDDRYGSRKKSDHNYPDYFPQAKSNPQEIYIYPDAALGEFRKWFREVYLPTKFPNYMKRKARQIGMAPGKIVGLLALINPKSDDEDS